MGEWLIYGKHTKSWQDKTNRWRDPDARFAALDGKGCRVSRLDQAMSYATKQDALEVISRPETQAKVDRGEVCFEIRRARG